MDKLKSSVGFIHFIVILDNNGKRIYARYFSQQGTYLADVTAQKEFEKKIGHTVLNLNVNKNSEVDTFTLNEFSVVCKIYKEIAIFIGASQDDNECIVANILDIFEECLDNITKSDMSKKNILQSYQQITLLIDEMIDEGIAINTDSENLENRIYMREGKSSGEGGVSASSSGGYFSSFFSSAKTMLSKGLNS